MTDFNVWGALAGPMGGMFATAFGLGAAGGYGFSARTILKISNGRIVEMKAEFAEEKSELKSAMEKQDAECNRRIGMLETRQRELEDMLLGRRALGFFSADQVVPADMTAAANKLRGNP